MINEGGWHFSYLLTAEEIQRKIKTFAHTELDQEKFTSLKNINESIQKGSDVFHRQVNYKKVEIDYSYPEYIIKNKMLLTDWIC